MVGKLLLLRVLSLARCGNVTDEGVACLAGLHQVVSLHLGGVHQVTDAALADVAGLERLRTLSLRHCTRLTDVALQHLSTSKSLLELDIVGCHSLTNSGLAALATLRLRRVDLAGCKGIAGSCVRPDVQLISEAAALCPDGRDGT